MRVGEGRRDVSAAAYVRRAPGSVPLANVGVFWWVHGDCVVRLYFSLLLKGYGGAGQRDGAWWSGEALEGGLVSREEGWRKGAAAWI